MPETIEGKQVGRGAWNGVWIVYMGLVCRVCGSLKCWSIDGNEPETIEGKQVGRGKLVGWGVSTVGT